MSNDYSHFAVELPLTHEQAIMAKATLATYGRWALAQEDDGEVFEDQMSDPQLALFKELYKNGEFGCDVGFDLVWDEEDAGDPPILTDDGGMPNLDLAGEFIRHLIKEYDLEDPVAFHWAATTDRNRPSGWGGGAAIIRADGIEWMNTHSWIDDRMPTVYSMDEAMKLRDDEIMDIDSGALGARLALSDDERETLIAAYQAFVDQVDQDVRSTFVAGETMRNWDIFSILRINGYPLDAAPSPRP